MSLHFCWVWKTSYLCASGPWTYSYYQTYGVKLIFTVKIPKKLLFQFGCSRFYTATSLFRSLMWNMLTVGSPTIKQANFTSSMLVYNFDIISWYTWYADELLYLNFSVEFCYTGLKGSYGSLSIGFCICNNTKNTMILLCLMLISHKGLVLFSYRLRLAVALEQYLQWSKQNYELKAFLWKGMTVIRIQAYF